MWFKQPAVSELIKKCDFKALMDIVNGKDENLANDAVKGLAQVIANPFTESKPWEQVNEEILARLRRFLTSNSLRTTEVMLSLLQRYPIGDGAALAASAIIARGDLPRLLDELDKRVIHDPGRRKSVFLHMLKMAIAANDSRLTLTTLASVREDDEIEHIHPREIARVLSQCAEEELLKVVKESRNYSVIHAICTTLSEGKIGTEKSLEVLASIPNVRQPGGFSSTQLVAELAIKSIKTRLQKASV